MLKAIQLTLIVLLLMMSGCSSITSQTKPICELPNLPEIDPELMLYPEEPIEVQTTRPRDAIKGIVENNIRAREHRDQLTKLINKIKTYQEKLSEKSK